MEFRARALENLERIILGKHIMFLGAYKNRIVLVTGHSGFCGGWLSLWLAELGAKVIGYSLKPPTRPNFFEAVGLKKIISSSTIADIKNYQRLKTVILKYKPEIVFHLAAQPLVRASYRDPRITFETNVCGTVNMLEAIRESKSVRSCVIVTSDKCYENNGLSRGYKETDPVGGYDPYSASKGSAELVVSAYRNSFFNPERNRKANACSVASVRSGNIIGGGDWGEDRIVPDCIKSLSSDKSILMRNPGAVRPWQYVLEPLAGYLWLGALMYKHGHKFSGAWNFGPCRDRIVPVRELVAMVIKNWGKGKFHTEKHPGVHEAEMLRLDCAKANSRLKWSSVYKLKDAIGDTVQWYKEFYAATNVIKMRDVSKMYLYRYVKIAGKKKCAWTR